MGTKIFGAPGRYVQGYDELRRIEQHVSRFGKKFLIILVDDPNIETDFEGIIRESFGKKYELIFIPFSGECTRKRIDEYREIVKEKDCDCVIGMGGGKAIDVAKGAGLGLNKPVVIIPTIAATDAPTSCYSCMYYEDGTLDEEFKYSRNPDLILVDTKIIMEAPLRFLVAGMGDALSTFIGARIAYDNYKYNDYGGHPTETAYAIAKLSYETLLKHGLLAKKACENKVMTKDLEKIIETNILMSGIGFESNGGGTDHSFSYGFGALKERPHIMHGEAVTVSTLASLILEGRSKEEVHEVFKFCIDVGLPVCLDDLGLSDLTEEEFEIIAESVKQDYPANNQPFKLESYEIIAALKTMDSIGKMYKEGKTLV